MDSGSQTRSFQSMGAGHGRVSAPLDLRLERHLQKLMDLGEKGLLPLAVRHICNEPMAKSCVTTLQFSGAYL